MTEDWEAAIAFVLRMEGGYTVDPNDPGGETNFGISKKAYPALDIANLTVEQAKALYRRDFWRACHCDELPRAFALATFDCAVNMGEESARRMLQLALDVDVDGAIGQKTIQAAFKAGPRRVMKFLAVRLAEYTRRIVKNPRLEVFAVNWSFRVISLAEVLLVPNAS